MSRNRTATAGSFKTRTEDLNLSSDKVSINFDRLYYGDIQRAFLTDLLKKEGDFLLRRGSEGGIVLSVHHRGEIIHFKFQENQREYRFEGRSFHTLNDLILFYYSKSKHLSDRSGAKLLRPVEMAFDMIKRDRVKLDNRLGAGNFGDVWCARLFPDPVSKGPPETVAVKMLTGGSGEKERQECLAEARIMSMMDHENVVGIRGVCFSPAEGETPAQLLLVLEYCNHGSLDKLLEKDVLSEEAKMRALWDAAKGLAYLHEREILHRDIASRNCLAHKTEHKFIVKISDFGLSRASSNYVLVTKRRLPIFSLAPETLKSREWTKMSDVWSFGILAMEVYNKGKNPYEEHYGKIPPPPQPANPEEKKKNDGAKQLYLDLDSGVRLDPPPSMPQSIVSIVTRCTKRYMERPTMQEIAQDLKQILNK